MKIDLDLKTLITIVAFAAGIGGFYYTTQMRLDNIEEEMDQLYSEIKKTNKLIRKNNK